MRVCGGGACARVCAYMRVVVCLIIQLQKTFEIRSVMEIVSALTSANIFILTLNIFELVCYS